MPGPAHVLPFSWKVSDYVDVLEIEFRSLDGQALPVLWTGHRDKFALYLEDGTWKFGCTILHPIVRQTIENFGLKVVTSIPRRPIENVHIKPDLSEITILSK